MVVPINPHLSNPPSPYFLLLYLRRRVRCVDSQWVRCVDSQWCKDAEITVPITDFCPGGGVCCATCTHFDLSQPAFGIIADPVAGVIPLAYQRVPCSFPTSITFRVTGTNYWMNVLLLRVGGPGEVALVEVSSKNDPNWRPLTHDWGTNWISAPEVDEHICKLAKKGLTPSQIGVILRDSHGIAQVSGVTGSKVLRILKAHGT
ncbi:unnamed protein product [Closterium sp. Naga37s-1]|nr:unnamed protein product [Closterium sp. Naga37s-1]